MITSLFNVKSESTFFFLLGLLDMLILNQHYYFLLPSGSAGGCDTELRDFLYLNF